MKKATIWALVYFTVLSVVAVFTAGAQEQETWEPSEHFLPEMHEWCFIMDNGSIAMDDTTSCYVFLTGIPFKKAVSLLADYCIKARTTDHFMGVDIIYETGVYTVKYGDGIMLETTRISDIRKWVKAPENKVYLMEVL